jgi:hypothetical protein
MQSQIYSKGGWNYVKEDKKYVLSLKSCAKQNVDMFSKKTLTILLFDFFYSKKGQNTLLREMLFYFFIFLFYFKISIFQSNPTYSLILFCILFIIKYYTSRFDYSQILDMYLIKILVFSHLLQFSVNNDLSIVRNKDSSQYIKL